MRECPNSAASEAAQLLREMRAKRDAARAVSVRRVVATANTDHDADRVDATASSTDCGTIGTEDDGITVRGLLLDSGADTSLVAKGVHEALEGAQVSLYTRAIAPVRLAPAGSKQFEVRKAVRYSEDIIKRSVGQRMLRGLECYVEEDNSSIELTVGRPIMSNLGIQRTSFSLALVTLARSGRWTASSCTRHKHRRLSIAPTGSRSKSGR